jgi:hypothetical protein
MVTGAIHRATKRRAANPRARQGAASSGCKVTTSENTASDRDDIYPPVSRSRIAAASMARSAASHFDTPPAATRE